MMNGATQTAAESQSLKSWPRRQLPSPRSTARAYSWIVQHALFSVGVTLGSPCASHPFTVSKGTIYPAACSYAHDQPACLSTSLATEVGEERRLH